MRRDLTSLRIMTAATIISRFYSIASRAGSVCRNIQTQVLTNTDKYPSRQAPCPMSYQCRTEAPQNRADLKLSIRYRNPILYTKILQVIIMFVKLLAHSAPRRITREAPKETQHLSKTTHFPC